MDCVWWVIRRCTCVVVPTKISNLDGRCNWIVRTDWCQIWFLWYRIFKWRYSVVVNLDYLRVCEESYKSDFGSDSCADAIQLAFKTVQNLMQYKGGRDYLDSAFSLYPKFSQEDLNSTTIQNFYANLISQFQGAVQYNKINGVNFRFINNKCHDI